MLGSEMRSAAQAQATSIARPAQPMPTQAVSVRQTRLDVRYRDQGVLDDRQR
jgi:hypothetical protein